MSSSFSFKLPVQHRRWHLKYCPSNLHLETWKSTLATRTQARKSLVPQSRIFSSVAGPSFLSAAGPGEFQRRRPGEILALQARKDFQRRRPGKSQRRMPGKNFSAAGPENFPPPRGCPMSQRGGYFPRRKYPTSQGGGGISISQEWDICAVLAF